MNNFDVEILQWLSLESFYFLLKLNTKNLIRWLKNKLLYIKYLSHIRWYIEIISTIGLKA